MMIENMDAKTVIQKWASILLILTLCLNAQLAFSEQLKLGIFKFSPWGMSKNNKIDGIIWEYYQAILKEADLKAEITLIPYPRMIKQLVEGKLDCAIFTKNFEPFQNIAYLFDLTAVAISRKGTVINDYDDFKQQKLMDIFNTPWYEIKKIPVWLQCSKHIKINPATIARLKSAALKIKAQGLFEQINKKWFFVDPHQDDQP